MKDRDLRTSLLNVCSIVTLVSVINLSVFNVHYHVSIFFIWSLSLIKFLLFDQSCELHAGMDVIHVILCQFMPV